MCLFLFLQDFRSIYTYMILEKKIDRCLFIISVSQQYDIIINNNNVIIFVVIKVVFGVRVPLRSLA